MVSLQSESDWSDTQLSFSFAPAAPQGGRAPAPTTPPQDYSRLLLVSCVAQSYPSYLVRPREMASDDAPSLEKLWLEGRYSGVSRKSRGGSVMQVTRAHVIPDIFPYYTALCWWCVFFAKLPLCLLRLGQNRGAGTLRGRRALVRSGVRVCTACLGVITAMPHQRRPQTVTKTGT